MTTKEFVDTIKTILPVVDKVPHSLGFHAVEMDGDFIYAFNTTQGYKVSFPSGVKGAFNPYSVVKVIDSWPNTELSITIVDGKIKFKADRNSRTVPLIDASVIREFRTAENDEKPYLDVDPGTFPNLLKQAILPNNKILPGVIVHEGNIFCTNNTILFRAEFGNQTDTFRIPEVAIAMVSRHRILGVKTSTAWIQFDIPEGTFLSRGYDLENIPLESFVPYIEKFDNENYLVQFEATEAFTTNVGAISGFTGADGRFSMEFGDDGVLLTFEATDGKIENFVEVPVTLHEDAGIVSVEMGRILPFLKKGKTTVSIFVEGGKVYFFLKGKDFTALLATYR